MMGRRWLEVLKGTTKRECPEHRRSLERIFQSPTPTRVRKVRKPLSAPFCTFRTPTPVSIQKNCATGRGDLYER